MKRWYLLVALVAGLAFIAPSAAQAIVINPPSPGVICDDCNNSGTTQGCKTVGDSQEDGGNNTISAWYHWCWINGQVYGEYGYCTYGLQAGFVFNGYSEDYNFGYGHMCVAHFAYFFLPWVSSTSRRCISVNGWGQFWVCRAWYE